MYSIGYTFGGITMAVLFGILQGALVIFVFAGKKRFQQHRLLVFFISTLIFVQIHSFLMRSGLMAEVLFLLNTNVPFILLFGPLLYLYTSKLLRKKSTKISLILHVIPFVFYLGYSFNFFLQDASFKYNVLIQTLQLDIPFKDFVKIFPSDPWEIQGWVVVEFISIHLVGYALLSLFMIYKNKPSDQSRQLKSQIQWLKYLNGLLLVGGLILFLSEGGVVNGKVFFVSPFPNISGDLFSTLAMYGTSLYLIRKPEFLNVKTNKYGKSSLSKEFKKEKTGSFDAGN